MNIEYMNGSEQLDYENGCIQISADNQAEAFRLGLLFADLGMNGLEALHYNSEWLDKESIRIPLTNCKEPQGE